MLPIQIMVASHERLTSSLVDAKRLLYPLNTKPSATDHGRCSNLTVFAGQVRFRDVHFSHGSQRDMAKNINLEAAGWTMALVGET